MLKVAVRLAEATAVLAAAAFVVLLFANEPSSPAAPAAGGGTTAGGSDDSAIGEEVFAQRCAGCHGRDGGGGSAPRLAGGAVIERFPDPAEQVAVVRDGRGGMPGFGSRLSETEIEAVVSYTREGLG